MNIVDYIKIVVLKIDNFASEVVDENNFGIYDKYGMDKFIKKYNGIDGYITMKILIQKCFP